MTKLVVDPKRQAQDGLRGYIYQILHSISAWVDLGDGEELYLEGAEDLDFIDGDAATVGQVRDTVASGNITFRTPGVVDAINNYWAHCARNPGRELRYRYLTTSSIGMEKGDPIGLGRPGLQLWNDIAAGSGDIDGVDATRRIVGYLAAQPGMEPALAAFLASATPESAVAEIITPISWVTGLRQGDALVRQIKDRLVEHGAANGLGPADSEAAFDALYRAAFDAAKDKSLPALTRASFLRCFADATAIQIPKQDLLALVRSAVDRVQPADAVAVRQNVRMFEGSPPLPSGYFRRGAVEQLLIDALSLGSAVVHGSTGTGKTLLASSALANDAPLWLNLRDLDPVTTKARLLAARDLLHGQGVACTLVLDDLDGLADPRLLEGALGSLWNCLTQIGGKLIVTSDRPLAARLTQAIGLATEREIAMPPFDEDEVHAFLAQSDCPDELLKPWSSVLVLATYGHPQLLHARISALGSKDYPPPEAEDLLRSSADTDRVTAEARRIIADLPDGARELLYRASLLTGSMPRQRLMNLARIEPPLVEPGRAIDVLAGPWLENGDADCFRLSPLARGAADDARGLDWVKRMHGRIGWIFLLEKTLTPWDVSAVMMHSVLSGRAGPLAHMMQSVLSVEPEVWEVIADACRPYSVLGLDENKLSFARPVDNFLFRIFQYRIAAVTKPELAMRLAALTDAEFAEAGNAEGIKFFRFLFLSQLLSEIRVQYPLAVIIQRGLEYIRLGKEVSEGMGERWREPDEQLPLGPFVQFLVLPLMHQVENAAQLKEFLAVVGTLAQEDQAAVVRALGGDDIQANLLANRLWLSETHAAKPDWPAFCERLESLVDLAIDHDALPLVRACGATLIRALDEDAGNISAALTASDRLAGIVGDDPAFSCARAMVIRHSGDLPRALAVWKDALSRWPDQPDDLSFSFAARSAAIAAAEAQEWLLAREFFALARERSGGGRLDYLIGLKADIGLSLYMLGDKAGAISIFGEVFRELEPLQSDLESEPTLSLQRRFGGILAMLDRPPTDVSFEVAASRLAGMSSNLDPFITSASHAPPLDTLRQDLVKLELAHGEGLDISLREVEAIRETPYIGMRVSSPNLLFEIARRTGDFQEIAADALRFSDAMALMQEGPRDVLRLYLGPPLSWPPANDQLALHLLVAALFAAASADAIDTLPLDRWRSDTVSHPHGGTLLRFVDHLEGLFQTGAIAPWPDVIQSSSGEWSCHVASALAATLLIPLTPESRLQCHALWASYLSQPFVRDLTGTSVSELVSAQWLGVTESPALFVTPRISLPILADAVGSDLRGWAKTRAVLVAALGAVAIAQDDHSRVAIANIAV